MTVHHRGGDEPSHRTGRDAAHSRGDPGPAAQSRGDPGPAAQSRGDLPDRAFVLASVADAATRVGRPWAWQGAEDAPERWVRETGPHDLDLWCAGPPGNPPAAGQAGDLAVAGCPAAEHLRLALNGARVAHGHHPRSLRHVSLAIETSTGPAVVDFTYGDLRVGPILLVPDGEIEIDPGRHRLLGAAAVADLFVRPVLRGRLPEPARLAQARGAWSATDVVARDRLTGRLARQLGPVFTGGVVDVLAGRSPDPALPRRARRRLLARSLAPGTVSATWARRATVISAGHAAGPLGLRVRGVVVALVGTDGAGKSTVADHLDERLRGYGLATARAYFGMARGNLPGVAMARRLLGVSAGPAGPPSPAGSAGPPSPAVSAGPPARPARTVADDRPLLRRAGAWFYAVEYAWRYARTVAPHRSRRRVVIVDRWVYDLRESPWPGSAAGRVAQRLLPDPDILVLPDAPIEQIHARKPERTLAEQAAQQERYRRLLAEHPARYAEIIVDTSGGSADPLGALVTAVVEAAHGNRRGAGR